MRTFWNSIPDVSERNETRWFKVLFVVNFYNYINVRIGEWYCSRSRWKASSVASEETNLPAIIFCSGRLHFIFIYQSSKDALLKQKTCWWLNFFLDRLVLSTQTRLIYRRTYVGDDIPVRAAPSEYKPLSLSNSPICFAAQFHFSILSSVWLVLRLWHFSLTLWRVWLRFQSTYMSVFFERN